MNESDLKKAWNKVGDEMNSYAYAETTIEQFIHSRSRSIKEKIEKLFATDIALKLIIASTLLWNIFSYWGTPSVVYICLVALGLVGYLTYFEIRIRRSFLKTADPAQDTRKNLESILSFLQSRFDITAWSIASTYLFLFTSGLLAYFYLVYGRVRPLDAMDYFVFGTFYLIGIVMNLAVVKGQVKYFVKHLEACLSDFNADVLAVVSRSIETQQKQDKIIKVLLGLLVIFGFVALIAVLKQIAV